MVEEPCVINRVGKHRWIGPHGCEAGLIDNRTCIKGSGETPIRQPHVNVLVPKEHRGKGFGKALLKRVLRDLAEDNRSLEKQDRYYRLFAGTDHLSSVGAGEFFEKMGFRPFDRWYTKEVENY